MPPRARKAADAPAGGVGPADVVPAPRSTDYVQSLERGLAVIRAFSGATPELTLSDVARATGLTRAAARRFLLTLVQLGYIDTSGRTFRLTSKLLELGFAYLSSLTLPEVAEPHLQQLVRVVHESSSVSILDKDEVVYVARVPSQRIMTVFISVGTRFPAYVTSMGRVLLAGLPDAELDAYLHRADIHPITDRTIWDPAKLRAQIMKVRSAGYSIVDQELEAGLRSVAVPIRDRNGTVTAAINVSAHATRASVDSMRRELLPPLRVAAEAIEADLRGFARRPPILR